MHRLISGFAASLAAAALLATVFGAATLRAQMQPVGAFIQGSAAGCVSHYCGPGDIISFTAWGSCMFSYTYAYALPGTNPACDFSLLTSSRTVQISTCTLSIGTNGSTDWDVATPCPGGKTVNQFSANALGSPNVATGSGSASGTVLTITGGCTGTFKVGYEIATGHYITSFGTGSGCAGTYNLNVSTSIGAGTITGNPPFLNLQKIYDQTGNNACNAASCDLIQNTIGTQLFVCPEVVGQVNCSGMPKGMVFQAANVGLDAVAANVYVASSPLGISTVGQINGGVPTADGPVFIKAGGFGSATTVSNSIYETTTDTGTWACHTGGGLGVFASDSAFHAGNCQLIDNPATSTFNVDGTVTTSTTINPVDTNPSTANPRISGRNSAPQPLFYVGEFGWKAGDMTSVLEALCKNQHKRYGGTLLPGTC